MEKAFDRVPRKVMEWAMRTKGVAEVLVKVVVSASLYRPVVPKLF